MKKKEVQIDHRHKMIFCPEGANCHHCPIGQAVKKVTGTIELIVYIRKFGLTHKKNIDGDNCYLVYEHILKQKKLNKLEEIKKL